MSQPVCGPQVASTGDPTRVSGMAGSRWPGFFIVGAPKCGTTALSEYLRSHPNVFFSDPKEPLYFASDVPGRIVSTERAYLGLFDAVDPARHLAVGEGSACYLFSQVAVPRILSVRPDAKLIVIVRNPVDMVPSWHGEQLFAGEEDIVDFEEAWRAEADRRRNRRVPLWCRSPEWVYYSEWGKLGSQLERLYGRADRSQVLVIVFDDLVRNTRKVYTDVLSFLGLPDDGRTEFPVFNERKQVRSVFIQNCLAVGEKVVNPLRRTLGRTRGFGLRTRLLHWNAAPDKGRPLRKEFQAELRAYYADEVALLSRLIGRDLSYWSTGDGAPLRRGTGTGE